MYTEHAIPGVLQKQLQVITSCGRLQTCMSRGARPGSRRRESSHIHCYWRILDEAPGVGASPQPRLPVRILDWNLSVTLLAGLRSMQPQNVT